MKNALRCAQYTQCSSIVYFTTDTNELPDIKVSSTKLNCKLHYTGIHTQNIELYARTSPFCDTFYSLNLCAVVVFAASMGGHYCINNIFVKLKMAIIPFDDVAMWTQLHSIVESLTDIACIHITCNIFHIATIELSSFEKHNFAEISSYLRLQCKVQCYNAMLCNAMCCGWKKTWI